MTTQSRTIRKFADVRGFGEARIGGAGAYLYDHARLPRDRALVRTVDRAAARLAAKLTVLRPDLLPISPYIRRHLRLKIESLDSYLQLYAFILSWSLVDTNVPLEDLVFCEYGAGSGILAMLAKELGVGTVVYNDIYDVACHDAEIVAHHLGCKADWYVTGDLADLISVTTARGLQLSTLASYDVIEHVYDVVGLHAKLPSVVTNRIVMASGANPFHMGIRRNLIKQHKTFEHTDRAAREGQKERDTVRSHRAVRHEIIEDMGVNLSAAQIDTLAHRTRGLIRDDIEQAVRRFLDTGQLPVPTHPTNTCDPYTGNWQEQLINPFKLADALKSGGCETRVLAGYYGSRGPHPVKRLAKRAVNLAIRTSGTLGLALAPFYMVCGWHQGDRRG